MKSKIVIVITFMLFIVTGCGGKISENTQGNDEKGQNEKNSANEIKETNETKENLYENHPKVEIVMEDGQIMKFVLFPEYAPITVENFISLATAGFYDGLTFHRVIEDFMIQGGDPSGDGTGGSKDTIQGEFASNGFTKNTLSHKTGIISMARSMSPNSASSQFFIVTKDAVHLDGEYAAFGELIEGEETLHMIASVEVKKRRGSREKSIPVEDIIIKTIRVVEE